MNESALGVGLVTALRFVTLPAFALLVLVSLGYHHRTRRWLPLWQLGAVLGLVTLAAAALFALAWLREVGRL